jgi:integrase
VRLAITDLAIQRLKFDKQTRVMDSQVRGFGILVSQTTKTFIVIKGKDRKLTTLGRYPSVSLKTARSEAKRILADPTSTPALKTYPEAVQSFVEARTGKVNPKTLKRYRYYLDTLAFTGNLNDLTRKDINERLKKFDGRDRAQNACFSCLRTFLNWCLGEEIITRHPIFRARTPNAQPSRSRVLTDEELKKIWNATDYKPYGYIVRLAILTAGRKLEVRNLIHDGEHLTFKDTKNKTDHTLPITPLIREHLMEPGQKFEWVRSKAALDTKCGVTGWRLHDLRRTWATNAARLGVRPETIERVLNHKLTGVAAVYQRWHYMPEITEALLTVEAHIKKITAPV